MKTLQYDTKAEEALLHIRSVRGNVPMHRRESRHIYSFSALPFAEQLAIWDQVWRCNNDFRVRLHAYFFLERHLKNEDELLAMWPVIARWQEQVDDWGLCDALAKVYTKILVVAPEIVYTRLKLWNAEENLWKRRQSVVSLLYYSRTKKNHPSFEDVAKLVSPLLSDREYYVQKGVGWCLRELNTVYPEPAMAWLTAHIKLISPIAFTIAIEKLDSHSATKLKELRKRK